MYDNSLKFFHNATITAGATSPVIDIADYDKYSAGKPLPLIISYSGGLLAGRLYRVIYEQSNSIVFSIVKYSCTVEISDSAFYFNAEHANKNIVISHVPIVAQYHRVRLQVGGATPRQLQNFFCRFSV